jgi:hypothetical protein
MRVDGSVGLFFGLAQVDPHHVAQVAQIAAAGIAFIAG